MRQSQNSVQLFHSLASFIPESAHLNIVAESRKYMDGETLVDDLLFKFIMKKYSIDTHATATHLWENMTNLDTYMSNVNSNIENSNQYVKVNVEGLKAGGDLTDYLMINLPKAYQVVSDI